ncbi:MAG: hypothetical protein JW860_06300 [Sedimentisphaerales bacterium]|nr:hypothetical protein [Sedimentisphaerales bacterium]
MKPADDIKSLFEKSTITAGSETDSRILGDALDALPSVSKAGARPEYKWRTIMHNRITKYAAAAVIFIAVLIGLNLVPSGGSSGVALANVLENIRGIRSFVYRMRTNAPQVAGMPVENPDHSEFELLVSRDYGSRVETFVTDEKTGRSKYYNTTYILPQEASMICVIPEDKMYARINMTDELRQQLKDSRENFDPHYFIEDFIAHPYTQLGVAMIDGIEVFGFESTDLALAGNGAGRSVARLWVDLKTEFPVSIEVETYSEDGETVTSMFCYAFEWDVKVTASDFEPVIPDDYNTIGELELSDNEQSVINGLGFYAHITGRYPSSLAVQTLALANEMRDAMMANYQNTGRDPGMTHEEMGQGFMNVEYMVVYYGTLATQNRAPAYFGDKVAPGAADLVLIRWRLDNGRYQVIFGDLRQEKVTEAELAQLEAMLPQ